MRLEKQRRKAIQGHSFFSGLKIESYASDYLSIPTKREELVSACLTPLSLVDARHPESLV
jgi:hypothetical protein